MNEEPVYDQKSREIGGLQKPIDTYIFLANIAISIWNVLSYLKRVFEKTTVSIWLNSRLLCENNKLKYAMAMQLVSKHLLKFLFKFSINLRMFLKDTFFSFWNNWPSYLEDSSVTVTSCDPPGEVDLLLTPSIDVSDPVLTTDADR